MAILALILHRPKARHIEGFDLAAQSLMATSTQALNAVPTEAEAKQYYRQLLIYINQEMRTPNRSGHEISADLRDRLFQKHTFKSSLTVEDILTNWPSWLAPLHSDVTTEPVVSTEDAQSAAIRILAFLSKCVFTRGEMQCSDASRETAQRIYYDFALRFVYDSEKDIRGTNETDLLKGYRSPLTNV